MKRKATSQSPEPGLGLGKAENVFRFLNGIKRINGNGSNSNGSNINNNDNKGIRKSKKRRTISEYSDKISPNEAKKLVNKEEKEEARLQTLKQDSRQAAEERVEAARQRKPELLPPVNSTVGKSANDKEENDTEAKIISLNVRLSELKKLLPTSLLQSALSFFRRTQIESIETEIKSIEKQISDQQTYLNFLKKDSKDRRKPVSLF